ncbi:uncharacterized protein EI90DRAFT_3087925 [Cantharellus anzutake]|uniref:uncharacterized protein n=1 Tax=Cantharellus anzutake TaxID=1750568 RepID=UPI001904A19C|nr:uncharacterized protein EI90DRAFT_3087925 [Cantharellus anzutake]KAF8315758.1 hypothetical protein EI90DRAFT_3087925 [Cantharellus anzutake]
MLFAVIVLQALLSIGGISCGHASPELEPALVIQPSVLGDNLRGGASSPIPWLQLEGYVNLIADVSQFRSISILKGHRVNVNIVG